ncbi:hypothetical protein ACFQ0K_17815 [Nocardioides caeni]|nr:hypothetical protein [Nocardioides caeni]
MNATSIPCPQCHAPAGEPCTAGGDHFARVVKAEALAVGNVTTE